MSSTHPPARFDFGLALAGAVSGGAYIAGVVDFIVEAMDRWQAAKERGDPMAPDHDVVLCTVAGTSSGSLTAAALAGALQYRFPPVRSDTPEAVSLNNPLYDSWVNMTDITHLLGERDANVQPLQSFFDSTNLDIVARKAIDFGAGIPVANRRWLSWPLRFAFTVTNLRGVPYSLRCFPASASPQQTMHADVMRFAMTNFGPHQAPPVNGAERVLHFPDDPSRKWAAGGDGFAAAALGSAAFPGALIPRTLHRPTSDYSQIRFCVSQGPGFDKKSLPMAPSWSAVNPAPGPTYQFAAVDGGVMSNSPVDLVRADLNGGDVARSNPQRGDESDRAVLMVDPLAGLAPPGPANAAGLTLGGIAGSLLTALLAQVRFRPAELALAADDDVFSRFIISPPRSADGTPRQGQSLAGDFLAGFGGYLSKAFRRHDFLLGRCHAQRYLAHTFTLPTGNHLFDTWTADQRNHYLANARGELPIIPLVGDLHPKLRAEPVPPWPTGQAELDPLRPLLDRRLDVLYCALLRKTRWRYAGYPVWRWVVRPRLAKAIATAVETAVQAHRLT